MFKKMILLVLLALSIPASASNNVTFSENAMRAFDEAVKGSFEKATQAILKDRIELINAEIELLLGKMKAGGNSIENAQLIYYLENAKKDLKNKLSENYDKKTSKKALELFSGVLKKVPVIDIFQEALDVMETDRELAGFAARSETIAFLVGNVSATDQILSSISNIVFDKFGGVVKGAYDLEDDISVAVGDKENLESWLSKMEFFVAELRKTYGGNIPADVYLPHGVKQYLTLMNEHMADTVSAFDYWPSSTSHWESPSLVNGSTGKENTTKDDPLRDKVADNTKKIEEGQNSNASGTEYDGELTAMLLTPGRRDLASLSLEIEHANMRHTEGTVLLGSDQPKVKLIHQPSQFDYMSWGNWLGEVEVNGAPEAFTKGSFIVGRVTTVQEMPKAGTATYSGTVRGEYAEGGGVMHRDLSGAVNLTANFNTGKIGGSFAFKRGDGSPLATAAMPTAGSAIVGSDFHGQLVPVNATGNGAAYGKFYGAKAQEVGGGFYLSADDKVISGVFGAKK